MPASSSDVLFSPAVKAVQTQRGSRRSYERREEKGGFPTTVTPDLAAYIAERDSAYIATASAAGQPYVQHRGGPKGFIKVLDEKRLAFADFHGNRQYITTGNLTENPGAFLFLMDYAHRRRIKIWGRARLVENDPDLMARLIEDGDPAMVQQAIVFEVEAWDSNCPSHIPQKFDAGDVAATVSSLQARIAALEAENETLRAARGIDRDVLIKETLS